MLVCVFYVMFRLNKFHFWGGELFREFVCLTLVVMMMMVMMITLLTLELELCHRLHTGVRHQSQAGAILQIGVVVKAVRVRVT
jgi:hypothetical protein